MAVTNHYVKNLLTAALALPGITLGASATDADDVLFDFKHLDYREQDGLMRVRAEYFSLGIPIDDNNDLQLSLEYETMSGASPIFVSPGANNTLIQVTSGASITDERTAAAVRYRRFTDSGVIVITPGGSTENDYTSRSITAEYQWDTNNKNTTFSIGTGYAKDSVGATNQDLDEDKKGKSLFVGVTQILDTQSLLQVNLSIARETGYLSDPYKLTFVDDSILPDNRPQDRQQVALLARYIQNFNDANGSLHFDYRYYHDDWSIDAHTLEVSWNQVLDDSWLLTPSLRYYDQGKAFFYAPYFTATRDDGIYSSDYRLAGFGSVLLGLKIEKPFSKTTRLNFNAEYYTRRGDLKLIGDYSVDPEPLVSYAFTFGLRHIF